MLKYESHSLCFCFKKISKVNTIPRVDLLQMKHFINHDDKDILFMYVNVFLCIIYLTSLPQAEFSSRSIF